MKKFTGIFLSGFVLLSFVLTSCSGLLAPDEKPAEIAYGPNLSAQEQQRRTFEALWKDIEDNYIYFNSADVNWNSLHDKYLKQIESGLSTAELDTILNKLANELPNGSLVYQSRQQRIEQDITDTSKYGGIGAFVGFVPESVPHLVILDVMTGSPAEKAGLKAHDSILMIDGEAVQLDEGLGAVDRVRGPAGSSVDLTVQSPDRQKRTVKIERAEVSGGGQLKYAGVTGTNYGYLLFPPAAYDKMIDDVLQSLQELTTNRKLEGLILDLRIAGSRAGWPLEQLLTLFGDGVAGVLYSREQSQEITISGQDVVGSQSVPLVIIVGENTSGSPEIFAASLQASKRATVIGAPTLGEVEGVSAFYLPDGSRIFVESTSFHLPGTKETIFNGIQPDVQNEAGWDDVLPDNDPLINAAFKLLEVGK